MEPENPRRARARRSGRLRLRIFGRAMQTPTLPIRRFRRLTAAAVALPLVLLVLMAALLFGEIQYLRAADHMVDHTDRVIAEANHLLVLMRDAQSASRGFLVTGDAQDRVPYTVAQSAIYSTLATLRDLVSDSPVQQ